MCAVVILIPVKDLIIVGIKIPSVYVINVAISVIVNAVSGNFIFIDPDGSRKIRMGNIHSGINECDCDSAAGSALLIIVPCGLYVDINPVYAVRDHLANHLSLSAQPADFSRTAADRDSGKYIGDPADVSVIFQAPLVLVIGFSRGKDRLPVPLSGRHARALIRVSAERGGDQKRGGQEKGRCLLGNGFPMFIFDKFHVITPFYTAGRMCSAWYYLLKSMPWTSNKEVTEE